MSINTNKVVRRVWSNGKPMIMIPSDIPTQEKDIIPTEELQEVVADEGYILGKVNVEPIPSEYVIPSGEITITEQGTFDVGEYKQARVTAPFEPKFAQLINGTLTEVTAEDLQGVTILNDYAFYNQQNLRVFEVPETLQVLGREVFYKTNITQPLYLPPTVQLRLTENCFAFTSFSKIKCGGPLNQQIGFYFVREGKAKIVEFNEGVKTFINDVFQINNTVNKCILPSTTIEVRRLNYEQTLIVKAEFPPALSQSTQICSRAFVPYASITEYKSATNWSALTLYPLVKNNGDLVSIDTTTYTYACVIGNDLGIEDDNNYAIYNYTNGEWVKE